MSVAIPVVCCVIFRKSDGRFLIAQRNSPEALDGIWEFPGGKIEATETIEQAAEREIMEELGVRITVPFQTPFWVQEIQQEHGMFNLMFVICLIADGQIPAPLECKDFAFVTHEELRNFQMTAPGELVKGFICEASR